MPKTTITLADAAVAPAALSAWPAAALARQSGRTGDLLIEIDQLRLSLGGVCILHDVRLSLERGEIYGLLGPNGAGKSTTIAAALGLLERDGGRIRVLCHDPATSPHQLYARIGVLPEQNGFYDWLPAEDYLAFFAGLHGRPMPGNQARLQLAAVGLEPRPRQPIGTYSRGMRQRLGLARALVCEPALLILDEPTNGLDPRGRREIHDVLIELAGRGVGILLCTHLLDDVDRLCRRIGIIAEGRTVAEGAIADLMQSADRHARFRLRLVGEPPAVGEADRHVRVVSRAGEWWLLDLDPSTPPEAAWRELLVRGWPIAEIRRESGGLEQLYLGLTERPAA